MSVLLTQTGAILQQSAELLKNPVVMPAVKGLFDFFKNAFSNNKRAKERLEMIEKMDANEEAINAFKTNIDDLLYENEDLKKQLEKIVSQVEEKMKEAGMGNITKNNTMNISGDNSLGIQDISGGNITINK